MQTTTTTVGTCSRYQDVLDELKARVNNNGPLSLTHFPFYLQLEANTDKINDLDGIGKVKETDNADNAASVSRSHSGLHLDLVNGQDGQATKVSFRLRGA